MTKSKRNPVDVTVGLSLRRHRMAAGLSLEQLGGHIGVTYQQIQKYETGALRSYEKGNGSPDLARSTAAEAELCLSRFASGGSERLLGVTAESEAVTPLGDEVLLVPAEMTPTVAEILGMMVMTTCPIAHALRDFDGAPIRRKTEDEQAFVLHWFLRLAAEHGDGWREKANAHLHAILPRPERPSEAAEGRA